MLASIHGCSVVWGVWLAHVTRHVVYPPYASVFAAFAMDLSRVRVVILGQDPYHNTGQVMADCRGSCLCIFACVFLLLSNACVYVRVGALMYMCVLCVVCGWRGNEVARRRMGSRFLCAAASRSRRASRT